ncbi:ABC-F family ATP-binding cassette domain-containing protein [Acetobacterium sp. KB-1]|jgi:ATP-binding cassette subfamily F protein 3|uniref:ABC-F family ATP-binding cassette domain-containing protein n=1 Tax=Acetobacterium sp. KB-1 TaxID=2184575 RepID=UPI000DBEC94C|nr:ABC-F family ATP-binding cassette domain-containing protein [Acetobacterium sp. KB-1]AWW26022.1 ABC transporter ATP-binding protein [Acetobacterium sp. KB-1]
MLINIENLHFSYGIHEIFNKLNLSINEKKQIGLVGRNGTGKSTLLKLITGELIPDTGRISIKNGLSISYLSQESNVAENTTLLEMLTDVFKPLIKMEKRIKQIGDAITRASGEDQEKLMLEFGELQESFAKNHGYEYPSRIRGVINGLGFKAEDQNKAFSMLSGGEKTRATLGQILLQEPQLLLLDEPTNYLDIDALQWLEQYLKNYPGTFIIVSHDRYFIDKVCTSIIEVTQKNVKEYHGNYTQYAVKKRQDLMEQNHQYQQQMKEIKHQQEVIDRFRAYNSIKSSKRASSWEKALNKIELLDKVETTHNSHFSFIPRVKSGNDVLAVTGLKKSFDNRLLFQNMNFEIHRGDKIGIIGPNGAGKTTLFRILQEKLAADAGEIRRGQKVHIGYFDQEHQDLKKFYNENLLEALWDVDSKLTEGELRNILAAFLFVGDEVFKPINTLSGGEKARLLLARLMISQSNFLLMDEPTNHIDMDTKEILESALSQYEGTLLFISHDRYFLNRISTQIYQFSADGMEIHLGNYDDYVKHKTDASEREAVIAAENKTVPTKTQQKTDRKKQKEEEARMRLLKKKVKEIEEDILTTEQKIESIEAAMCAPDFYDNLTLAAEINLTYEAHKQQLSELTDSWEIALMALENE